MPVLNAANLKALNEMQMKTMPKEQRRDAMMKLAQRKSLLKKMHLTCSPSWRQT